MIRAITAALLLSLSMMAFAQAPLSPEQIAEAIKKPQALDLLVKYDLPI